MRRWIFAGLLVVALCAPARRAAAFDYCHLARTCSYCYFAVIPCLWSLMTTGDP
jgi:hypothetical protein